MVLELTFVSAPAANTDTNVNFTTLVLQSSPGTGNDLLLRELNAIWTKTGMVAITNENVTGASGENAGNPYLLYAYTLGTLDQTTLSNWRRHWVSQ